MKPIDSSDRDDQQRCAPATPPVVAVDPEVMGGAVCFAGTRVPVTIVLASLDEGVAWPRLVESYPFLTEAHIAAAREFAAAFPAKVSAPVNWLFPASTPALTAS